MKKTNAYFQRKRLWRSIIIILIVQILIILLACISFAGHEKATSANTTSVSFCPDEVSYQTSIGIGRHSQGDLSITITYDSIDYAYLHELHGYCPRDELIEELSNEKLYILYMTETCEIVDIQSETKIYYTMDNYNSEQTKQIIMGCILLSAAEIIFLGFSFLYVALKFPVRKIFRKNK